MMKNVQTKVGFLLLIFFVAIIGRTNAQIDSSMAGKKKMLGWYYNSSFGVMPLLDEANNFSYGNTIASLAAAYSIKASAGYRFFNSLYLGGGAATEFFDNKSVNIPVFAELRGIMRNKKAAPFYQAHVGWGFPFLREKQNPQDYYLQDLKVKGGITLGGGIGIAFRPDNNTVFTAGVSYRYQRVSYSYQLNNSYLYIQNYGYSRFELSIGFGFN